MAGLILLFCFFANQPTAHADGGAPNLAYVAGGGPGISVIDVMQQRIVRTMTQNAAPTMTQLSSDGSTLFIVQPSQSRALVVDAATGKTRCQANAPGQPSLLVLSKQEDGFFVAGNGDTRVREFDPRTCKLLHTISVPGPIYGLTTALDGGVFPTHTGLYQLCVATSNQVLIFDPDGKQLASYPVPAQPRSISAPPLDFILYVTTQQGSVVAIDLNANRVTPPLLSGGTFGPMDYDETTHEVYVPDMQHKQVDVIAYKPKRNNQAQTPSALLRVFPTNGVPVAVAITSDGQMGFIALQDGHVIMLDLPGRQTMQTFTVNGNPHFIITGVYPPLPVPASNQPEKAAQTSSTGSNGLLILFVVIFLLALGGLIVTLRMLWKQRR
ncbi:MAG TPA: PQQ-binding-like beta-propeller repeat protein [Ktedonobacteraceae bacterium]|nr:PQQ-binding-like beta-propeller repeat protein [Ktedonobacteraceae bacterium]